MKCLSFNCFVLFYEIFILVIIVGRMDHKARLKQLCRTCGEKIPLNAKSFDKFKYSDLIWELLSINCEKDSPDVHPSRICNRCRLCFSRRNVDKLNNISFVPHNDNCTVCTSHKRSRGRPKKGHCSTSQEPYVENKTVDEGLSDEEDSVDNFQNVVIHSLSVDRFNSVDVAQVFVCTVCRAVPCVPVVTSCSHIFCKECITGWFSNSAACPVCRSIVEETEISPLRGQLLHIYESLQLSCVHCADFFKISEIENHEMTCQFVKSKKLFDVSTRTKVFRLPLSSVSAKHARHKRLKPVISSVDSFCAANNENKADVYFFLLKDTLKSQGDARWKDIDNL